MIRFLAWNSPKSVSSFLVTVFFYQGDPSSYYFSVWVSRLLQHSQRDPSVLCQSTRKGIHLHREFRTVHDRPDLTFGVRVGWRVGSWKQSTVLTCWTRYHDEQKGRKEWWDRFRYREFRAKNLVIVIVDLCMFFVYKSLGWRLEN